MNHVPDEALAALDDLGEGLLVGDARPVDCDLREDLRLAIPLDDAAVAAGRVRVAFHLRHTRSREQLREHGPFVGTVVDGVETKLREWGVDPPERYAHEPDREDARADGDAWRVYAGRARL